MFQPGELIAGRYRIERTIGAGGMGLVYRAHDETLGERVAIKLLNEAVLDAPHVVGRFRREAKVLIRIDHPGVIDVREVAELENGVPYYVMELLEGRDLRQEQRARGFLPPEEAAGYVQQAARALQVVHDAGIIHRDLKPQNIFVVNLSGARQVKLIDFGISKLTEESEATLTATAAVLGTPHYMSPEQIFASKDVDRRADIWSMGVILYLLVTGRLPFARPSIPAVIAAIPNEPPEGYSPAEIDRIPDLLRKLIARCLQKDPALRFQSALELAEALVPFSPEGDIVAPEIGIPSTVPPVHMGRTPFRPNGSELPDAGVTRDARGFDHVRHTRSTEPDASVRRLELTAPSTSRRFLEKNRYKRRYWELGLTVAVVLVGVFFIVTKPPNTVGAPRAKDPKAVPSETPLVPAAPSSIEPSASAAQPAPAPAASAARPTNVGSAKRKSAQKSADKSSPASAPATTTTRGKDGAPLHL